MGKSFEKCAPTVGMMLLLTGCGGIGDKTGSLAVIYGAAAVLSLLLLAGYCGITPKRDPWYLLLFASVTVVNIGYFALAISKELGEALLANRMSYLGSVFLPLAMCMIILQATHIHLAKWVPGSLLALAVAMFLIAASPGYLPIYYKDVTFAIVDGVGTLHKVYGPLHSLYLVYLLSYFSAMVAIIIYTTAKGKIDSPAYAGMIVIAVFVNIGVWLIEQLVYIPFEILSISYIISESFLLGLHVLMAEAQKQKMPAKSVSEEVPVETPAEREYSAEELPGIDREMETQFLTGLEKLTPKERELYACYVAGMTTDVIMEKLYIKENTLKFHNKNLYGKLGVKSRKQLIALHGKLRG